MDVILLLYDNPIIQSTGALGQGDRLLVCVRGMQDRHRSLQASGAERSMHDMRASIEKKRLLEDDRSYDEVDHVHRVKTSPHL